MSDDYIKEDDLILVQVDKEIKEVLVKDISPSGKYMKTTNPHRQYETCLNTIHYLETLVSGEDEDTEYVDVEETLLSGEICNAGQEEDLIGDAWKVKIIEPEEPEEAEVITQNTLAEFDKRNKRT